MRSYMTLLVLLGVALVSACAPPGETEAERQAALQADLDALDQIRSDYETLYNAQDAAGVAALHTGDAVVSEPNQAPIVGGDAIESGLQAFFDQFDVRLSISQGRRAGRWRLGVWGRNWRQHSIVQRKRRGDGVSFQPYCDLQTAGRRRLEDCSSGHQ